MNTDEAARGRHRPKRPGSAPVELDPILEGLGGDPVLTGDTVLTEAPGADTQRLANRAARGAAVTLGGQGARVILQLASVVVLARLLTPRDYGLLALVLVVVGVGEVFRDFGLSTAAVQAKSLSTRQRDALFWLNTGFGIGMTILAFALARPIADLFHQPLLVHMIQVLSLTFTINGLATQYRADLNRRMRFGVIAAADVVGQAVGLGVGVACAALGASYWSLVAQQLTQLGIALLYLACFARWVPGRPRRGAPVSGFLRMGLHLAATQLLYYILNNLDTITIGVRFSSTQLGLYNRGFQVVSTPLNQMRSPATTVALPVLSRLQDDPVRGGEYIKRAQLALGYTIVPLLAIGAGAAKPVVDVILGARWTKVEPIFAYLSIAGCLSTLSFVGLWVYLSRGMAKQLMRYTAVSLVLQLVCILVGSHWGVVGVAAGYMVAAALEWPLSLIWLSRLTVLPVGDLFRGAARLSVCAAGAGLAALAVSHWLTSPASVVVAALAVVAGLAWYALAGFLSSTVRQDLVHVAEFGRRMVRR